MSEKEPTPPQAQEAQEALEETQLETAAGGGIIEDVKEFFGFGEKKTTFGGGSFGGGGAGGSW